jgi:hypothetical protein
MEGIHPRYFGDINAPVDEFGRVLTTPDHYAYLRIAEGCDNWCAFCIIPKLRGKYRSRPMESVLAEARALAARGVKELIVVAQDITRYGTDWDGRRHLADLLEELCKLDFPWIRLHYLYPEQMDDRLIGVISHVPELKERIRRQVVVDKSGSGSRLVISVFAQLLTSAGEEEEDRNRIALRGVICKPPVLRRTPLGRCISDMMPPVWPRGLSALHRLGTGGHDYREHGRG